MSEREREKGRTHRSCSRSLSPLDPPPSHSRHAAPSLSPLQFDAVFLTALSTKVSARGTFKARLDTYRFCDNVWTFVISRTEFKVAADGGGRGGEGGGGRSKPALLPAPGKVKLVCVDSKVVDGPEGGGGGGGGGGGAGGGV